jgi:tocopherol O-methyltransferase
MQTLSQYQQRIVDYYYYSEIDYRLLWHLNKKRSLHYGYWDASTRSLREALENMNRKFFEFSGASSGIHILDAGCGVGGTAIYFATHYDCHVTGITLPKPQSEMGKENVIMENLQHRVTILQGDYCNTGLPDRSFDMVCALESSCHAPDKKVFLEECFRLLKPNGILLIADYFEKPALNQEETIEMKQWADSWSIAHFWNQDLIFQQAAVVGFTNAEFSDRSQYILKSSKRLYWYFFPGFVLTHLFQLLRMRNRVHTKNTYSALYQYQTLKKGLWKYGFFKAIKPQHQ